jgi:hypothetical protein
MMALTSQTRRLLRRAVLLAVAISIGISSAAWATPCDPTIFQPVPDCQVQTQTPVRYDGWDTSYWAFYCGGDHPYFWGMSSGWILNFTWDNSCFSAIENVFGETEANKFSVLFTNWCITHQYVTVSLGCSKQPPPGFPPACNTVGDAVADPGCKQGTPSNHCSSTNPPICFETVTETCDDGTRYFCTADIGFVWCYKCGT